MPKGVKESLFDCEHAGGRAVQTAVTRKAAAAKTNGSYADKQKMSQMVGTKKSTQQPGK